MLLAALLLLAPGAADALQGSARWAPAPAFADEAPIPAPNPARLRQVENGRYDLLFDTQVRIDGAVETTYRRRAYKIVDRSGLEGGAQIELDFDPTYESLLLHHVRIIRDGRAIAVRDSVDVDILRKEKDSDDGILTGVQTVLLRLPAVRVGDIIDAAWSWSSRPPLWPGHYFGEAQIDWSVPVGWTRYRIDLPTGTRLATYRHRQAPAARKVERGGRTLIEWTSADPEPVVEDEGAPRWHYPWRRVALSTMPAWSEVAAWAVPLYAASAEFPAELADEVAGIERAGGSAEVRAVKALRLVQDRIRYTSLSIGTGSYRPRSPSQVVRQGWGDCKDKAQLLVAVLGRLGIEAYPALTDIDEGAGLPTKIPSPVAFDHVVVQLRIGGKSYWVDPTISHQGGSLAALAPLTYRHALPIRAGQRSLESIPLPKLVKPNVEAVETYRFGPDGMKLEAVTRYTGAGADGVRSNFAATALSEKEASYLRFYATSYPGLELEAPLRIEDDRDANAFVVRESYRLPAKAYADGKLLDSFPIRAGTLDEVFTYPGGGRRSHPLAITFPFHQTHKIVIVAPALSVPAPDDVEVDNDAFSFSLESSRSGDALTILFSAIGKQPVVPAKDFAGFSKDADTLAENLEWTLTLTPGFSGLDLSVLLAVLILVLFGLGIAGLIHANNRRDTFPEGETFYPVPLLKFLPLSIASWGMYALYWFWRNWNWVHKRLGEDIWPFWRAFFGIFWLYPLFERANDRAEKPLPMWLGAAGAAMYFLWAVGTAIFDRLPDDSMVPTAIGTLSCLFVIPAVIAVNRNNPVERVRANGRLGWLGLAVLVVGSFSVLLMFFV